MSRRFWGSVMFLALVLTAGSGYLMVDRLSVPEPQPVPLRDVPPEEAPPMPALPDPSVPTADASTDALATASPSPEPAPVAKNDGEKRNILFKLVRPNAKDVQIVGDFTTWMRQPMKKKGKFWEASVSLAPGSYEYAFVVDGKRVRDPNNKQSGANGKSSVLTVKPLAKKS